MNSLASPRQTQSRRINVQPATRAGARELACESVPAGLGNLRSLKPGEASLRLHRGQMTGNPV
jgi:hypothetical protein